MGRPLLLLLLAALLHGALSARVELEMLGRSQVMHNEQVHKIKYVHLMDDGIVVIGMRGDDYTHYATTMKFLEFDESVPGGFKELYCIDIHHTQVSSSGGLVVVGHYHQEDYNKGGKITVFHCDKLGFTVLDHLAGTYWRDRISFPEAGCGNLFLFRTYNSSHLSLRVCSQKDGCSHVQDVPYPGVYSPLDYRFTEDCTLVVAGSSSQDRKLWLSRHDCSTLPCTHLGTFMSTVTARGYWMNLEALEGGFFSVSYDSPDDYPKTPREFTAEFLCDDDHCELIHSVALDRDGKRIDQAWRGFGSAMFNHHSEALIYQGDPSVDRPERVHVEDGFSPRSWLRDARGDLMVWVSFDGGFLNLARVSVVL